MFAVEQMRMSFISPVYGIVQKSHIECRKVVIKARFQDGLPNGIAAATRRVGNTIIGA
ncbi:MAG: hypothetical protein ACYDBW_08985 [Sulfuricaulis sp.]